MRYVIDRIEGDYAVCQRCCDGGWAYIPVDELPEKAREGSYLEKDGQRIRLVAQDGERQERIRKKLDELWRK
ncbi:MAG: DUF3006 domain-containing protein [Christensenellales bacterium]|jgi:hypothetical protein